MKIRGAVLEEIGRPRPFADSRPITIDDLELDDPGPTELLVRIEAAGLCHSDLSVVDGNRVRPTPMLLGHEAAGIVEQAGVDASRAGFSVGDRVVLAFLPRCGECANCATNGRLPCIPGTAANNAGVLLDDTIDGAIRLHRRAPGAPDSPDRPGAAEDVRHHLGVSGFATHAVVDHRSAVVVGADVPPEVAAVLGCAVLTGGGAVMNAGALAPGEDAIVVGLGGVGMAALITAVSLGHGRVIGVDAVPAKLERARELGADEVYTPDEAMDAGIRTPLVVEAAGHPRAFETAFALTAPGGRTVTVGLPAPAARSEISPLTITAEARTIIGSYLGSAVPARDIPRYAQLWREGRLPVEELISDTIALDDINTAMDTLADGKAIRQIIRF
ncbi:alcohol dehydrogenase catalytic domain-containing protein [Microbacterium lacticum]|uniref:zinc-binding dehydrogenase n=1 Tax=Microbacterium lacticum TaxID=33885 RepID=UPI0018B04FEF|nr:zinc-binding dehydrogenase [Microbacterium lacticum]MBF9336864.1 alcohol dehydrogenase catalytic domain-containing protein [Microbacterium lacticum]